MSDTRQRNCSWTVDVDQDGRASFGAAQIAVLMDLRDELQRLNGILCCRNFLRVPQVLDRIAANTKRPKKRRAKKGPRR